MTVYVPHPHPLHTSLLHPAAANAATDPTARRRRSANTSATHQPTIHDPCAPSTPSPGTTCLPTAVSQTVVQSVEAATTAADRTGWQTATNTTNTSTTSTCAQTARDISLRLVTSTRYVIRSRPMRASADPYSTASPTANQITGAIDALPRSAPTAAWYASYFLSYNPPTYLIFPDHPPRMRHLQRRQLHRPEQTRRLMLQVRLLHRRAVPP
jgi:hypothetical protein